MAGSKEVAAAVAAILAMAAAQTAGAQAAPAQDDTSEQEGGLTEVIVTATRRAERLQDVPESITAFDADAISMRGLQQMDDYARFVPGLTVSERQPAGTTVVFRGVASSGLQFGAVSSSGLYLDEQPITQSGRNPDPRLMDVERIEALRGPQGTLYGASSQSGTLRVITNKPDPAKFGAWAEAQLNSVSDGSNGYDVSAMLNAPIVPDKLALRLVGFSSKDAGFIDNVLAPSQGETFDNSDVAGEDVNSIETTGGRAALRWDINENVNTTLGVTFQHVTT
jgi:iron complex outermembrane receptor protein